MKELDFNISDPVMGVNTKIIRDEIIENEEAIAANAAAITALGTAKANISSGSGAPSGGSDNDLYVDEDNDRLYVKVSGAWKYAGLT